MTSPNLDDSEKKRMRQLRLETVFAPVRTWCEDRRRRYTEIADSMTLLREKPVTRQMVLRWLEPHPDKMREPSLSDALLLQEVVGALQKSEARKPKLKP